MLIQRFHALVIKVVTSSSSRLISFFLDSFFTLLINLFSFSFLYSAFLTGKLMTSRSGALFSLNSVQLSRIMEAHGRVVG
jgi:hypothetical protein